MRCAGGGGRPGTGAAAGELGAVVLSLVRMVRQQEERMVIADHGNNGGMTVDGSVYWGGDSTTAMNI